jgi:D-glycero-alpha-D-manno-heptose-7-phosphate kinase
MLITRTPLRISLGGGGTDLPSYYQRSGGFVLSAAINKYIYIAANRTFTDDYLVKYSRHERVASIDDLQHPLVREALRMLDVPGGLELVSLADIPAGTGLGSSGSFTVGLLKALYALRREHVTAGPLAEQACHIEIDLLGEPVGKQDQYIAAFGGLTCFDFRPDDRVTVTPLSISTDTLHDLESHLLLFFTGYARSAGSILADQRNRSSDGDEEMLRNLDQTLELGLRIKTALEDGRPRDFGELMDEHWQRKRRRSDGMSNDQIDDWYRLGLRNGAVGGKLVGAGAGGFLMFYANDPRNLREALTGAGLTEVRFDFDHDGSTVLVRD